MAQLRECFIKFKNATAPGFTATSTLRTSIWFVKTFVIEAFKGYQNNCLTKWKQKQEKSEEIIPCY